MIFDTVHLFSSTGTRPWSSSCSPTLSWGLLCLRLWVCSVWWWRSSFCSPCKLHTLGNLVHYTCPLHPSLFPCFLSPSLSSSGGRVSRTGTQNELVGHSNQQKNTKAKIFTDDGKNPPIPHFYVLALIFVFLKFYVTPHFRWKNLSKINGWITKSLQCLDLLLAQKWIVAYPDIQLLSDVSLWFAAYI